LNLQALIGDQHQNPDRHGDPYLRTDGIPQGSAEHLDPRLLHDPPEKQFHAPSCFVELGEGQRQQEHVLGHESKAFSRPGISTPDVSRILYAVLTRNLAGHQ